MAAVEAAAQGPLGPTRRSEAITGVPREPRATGSQCLTCGECSGQGGERATSARASARLQLCTLMASGKAALCSPHLVAGVQCY